MRKALWVASCALSGMLVIGCDSKEESTPTTPQSTGNAVSDGVKNATGAVSDAAKKADTAVTDAADKAKDSASAAMDTAKQKLQQVTEYIGQKKYDLAETTLGEVEKVKPQLPQTLQDQITSL